MPISSYCTCVLWLKNLTKLKCKIFLACKLVILNLFKTVIQSIKCMITEQCFLFQPSSKKYFEDFCTSLENAEVEFMHQIFNTRSVLFLGCDPERPEYKGFFQKFAVHAKVNGINYLEGRFSFHHSHHQIWNTFEPPVSGLLSLTTGVTFKRPFQRGVRYWRFNCGPIHNRHRTRERFWLNNVVSVCYWHKGGV